MSDLNQFAAIPDADNDGCPDGLDDFPNTKNTTSCVDARKYLSSSLINDGGSDSAIIADVDTSRARALSQSNRVKKLFSKAYRSIMLIV